MSKNKELSIVVPVYECEDSLAELYKRLAKTLEDMNLPYEIILVDDGDPSNAWKLICELAQKDKNVKGILINIFGGIMRCDVLAKGVIEAVKEIKLNVPLVVRLAGTNFEEGKKILNESNLKILSATDLNDAAKKIVEAVG